MSAYIKVISQYSNEQFSATSAMFGAEPTAALRMFLTACIWYGMPVLTWVPFVPFFGSGARPQLRAQAGLILASVLPAFVFHAFVHVGDPDHTLFAVPMLCILGGWSFPKFGCGS